jgi:hypothetical protein
MRLLVVVVALLALGGCKSGGTRCHSVDVIPEHPTDPARPVQPFGFSSRFAEVIETADGVKIREYDDEGKLLREAHFSNPQKVDCVSPCGGSNAPCVGR